MTHLKGKDLTREKYSTAVGDDQSAKIKIKVGETFEGTKPLKLSSGLKGWSRGGGETSGGGK